MERAAGCLRERLEVCDKGCVRGGLALDRGLPRRERTEPSGLPGDGPARAADLTDDDPAVHRWRSALSQFRETGTIDGPSLNLDAEGVPAGDGDAIE